MKKVWLSVLGVAIVLVAAFYFLFSRGGNGSNSGSGAVTLPVATNTNSGTGAATATDMGSVTGNATGSGAPAPTGQYQDGTYTGSVADAIYGKLQLAVTISGGQITNITWPVYPNSPGHTSQVSASALPELEQEAIASQSANVNIVSGATQDSQAFQQSLASALAQAKS